jgi:citrate lyase subunit beta / citryl-CoA lyase
MCPRTVADARSLLFVPGDRPDRFEKALSAGADGVILDLEDAVAPERKSAARESVRSWLAEHPLSTVRINSRGTVWYDEDVALVAKSRASVMLPKTETRTDVQRLIADLGSRQPIVALIETALGVQSAQEISQVEGVVRTAFGHVDLAVELDVDPCNRNAFLLARSLIVMAARAAGLPGPLDGVTVAIDDTELLRSDVRHALSLGMAGKLCIHPNQIRVAHDCMTPDEADVRWAKRILATSSDGAAMAVDGQMVDAPVLERARRILARTSGSFPATPSKWPERPLDAPTPR